MKKKKTTFPTPRKFTQIHASFHLQKDILDDEINIVGFTTQRKDRLIGNGGGVVVYIHNSLNWHRRYDVELDDIECVWVELLFKKSKSVLLGNIYRPPDTSDYLPSDFNEKFKTMMTDVSYEEKEIIILGDLNCDYTRRQKNRTLKAIISGFGCCQKVEEPTRITNESKTLIDVILTNIPQNIAKTAVIESGLSDHHMVGTLRKLNNFKVTPRVIICRNYETYVKENFIEHLKNAPWDTVYNESEVENAYGNFEKILIAAVNKHVSLINKRVRGLQCPWRTPEIMQLIKQRDYHLQKAKRSGLNNDWLKYRQFQKRRRRVLISAAFSPLSRETRRIQSRIEFIYLFIYLFICINRGPHARH